MPHHRPTMPPTVGRFPTSEIRAAEPVVPAPLRFEKRHAAQSRPNASSRKGRVEITERGVYGKASSTRTAYFSKPPGKLHPVPFALRHRLPVQRAGPCIRPAKPQSFDRRRCPRDNGRASCGTSAAKAFTTSKMTNNCRLFSPSGRIHLRQAVPRSARLLKGPTARPDQRRPDGLQGRAALPRCFFHSRRTNGFYGFAQNEMAFQFAQNQ